MDQRQGHKGLADFIRQNEAAIIKEWVEFARTISPAQDVEAGFRRSHRQARPSSEALRWRDRRSLAMFDMP
jgi:hypothetical protein